jgi:DNA-binding NtrC family response regulator
VRVVAATNVNLQEKIAAGQFRADLFYRLARFQVELPPLRRRRDDIPLLAQHFLELFAGEMGARAPQISDEAMAALQSYDFPGNVRELKNMIERALILSGGKTLLPEHLQFQVISRSGDRRDVSQLPSLSLNLKEAELELMRRALDVANGNITEAARLLGVHRTKLYRVMGKWGEGYAG